MNSSRINGLTFFKSSISSSWDPRLEYLCGILAEHCAHRHIRLVITSDMAKAIACCLVRSWLNYANSLLFGNIQINISWLQSDQNTLTRVVADHVLPHGTHSSAVLHFLDVCIERFSVSTVWHCEILCHIMLDNWLRIVWIWEVDIRLRMYSLFLSILQQQHTAAVYCVKCFCNVFVGWIFQECLPWRISSKSYLSITLLLKYVLTFS